MRKILDLLCNSNKNFKIKNNGYSRNGIYTKVLNIVTSQMMLISKIDKIQIDNLLIRYDTNSLLLNLNKNGENINISIIKYVEHFHLENNVILIKDKNEFEKVALTIIKFIKKDNNNKFKFIVNQITHVEIKLEFDM